MAYKPKVLETAAGGTNVSDAGTSGNLLTSDGSNWQSATPVTATTANSAIGAGSKVTLTTATAANVTSISLAAGTWAVSGLIQFNGTPTVSGPQIASISTTSATNGTLGDNSISSVVLTTAFTAGDSGLSVPSYILTLGSTTTVYLVAQATFSAGSCFAYGRISAFRLA